jgi:hypothetical protein
MVAEAAKRLVRYASSWVIGGIGSLSNQSREISCGMERPGEWLKGARARCLLEVVGVNGVCLGAL